MILDGLVYSWTFLFSIGFQSGWPATTWVSAWNPFHLSICETSLVCPSPRPRFPACPLAVRGYRLGRLVPALALADRDRPTTRRSADCCPPADYGAAS
jgi:hypothetical protein